MAAPLPPVTDLPGLMALFEFTADDLAVNRAGALSPRQRARVEANTLNASIEKAAATLALPVLPAFTLVWLLLAWRFGDALGPWVLVGVVLWFASMAALFNLVYRTARHLLRRGAPDRRRGLLRWLGRLDSRIDSVLAASSVARLAGRAAILDDGEHQTIAFDGEPFMLDVSAELDERLWRLATGQRYAVYYLPEVLWIVAVEPLPEPEQEV